MDAFKDFLTDYLATTALWLFVTYATVVAAMAADLVSGIAKSRRLGRKCNSRGLKRTCEKAVKYFLPMICLTSIDLLMAVALTAPYLTMIFAAYCILCELKSVLESTHEKAEIEKVATIAELLVSTKIDPAKLKELFKLLENEKNN